MVEHLLQTGANVHARDDGGLIPLHNACSFGHSEVRVCLLPQTLCPTTSQLEELCVGICLKINFQMILVLPSFPLVMFSAALHLQCRRGH